MRTLCSEFFNKSAGLDEKKDVRPGRSVHYRTNETPDDVFQDKLDDELSGRAEQDRGNQLDDIWLDALRKQKAKEKERQPVMAFVVTSKTKK